LTGGAPLTEWTLGFSQTTLVSKLFITTRPIRAVETPETSHNIPLPVAYRATTLPGTSPSIKGTQSASI